MCLFWMDANPWWRSTSGRGCRQARRARRVSDKPAVQRCRAGGLAFATELIEDRQISRTHLAQLARHCSERQGCDIVFLVASERLYIINNIGPNIESAGMCEASLAG